MSEFLKVFFISCENEDYVQRYTLENMKNMLLILFLLTKEDYPFMANINFKLEKIIQNLSSLFIFLFTTKSNI